MKKKMMVGGLLPALVLSTCGLAGAQPAAMDTLTAMEQNPDAGSQMRASTEPVTQESLQEMRRQLEEQLQQAQELQNRLNAQLGSLEKRMKKVEKKTNEPNIEIHGYGRLRWDQHKFEGAKGVEKKSVWINLFTKYRINEKWSLFSEHEFENNLTDNTGAYEGNGNRPVLQLYAGGRVGDVNVKIGRYYLQSPYKFTYDEKVDGFQLNYGIPTKWGRKAEIKFNFGNTTSRILYGDPEHNLVVNGDALYWKDVSSNYRVISLMGEVPIAKNTNIAAHYGKITNRDDNVSRKTFSIGFDTKLNRDLKLTAAIAKSNAGNLNKSHFIQLQYKEARPDIPGSYDIYVKKYLQRGHTGLTNWFNDDIIGPAGDYAAKLEKENPGYKPWDHRQAEFNGIRIGADFVPIRNTKLMIHYTFGKLGMFSDKTGWNLTGTRENCGFLRTQLEMYF